MATQSRTASRCNIEAVTGTHVVQIDGYNQKKGAGIGSFYRSETFSIGGLDWAICFYPNGASVGCKNFVVIYLQLMSSNTEVRAHYHIRFVSQNPDVHGSLAWLPGETGTFKSSDRTEGGQFIPRHRGFALKSILEQWYVHDDRLTIQCDLTIIRQSILSGEETEIAVPPSDIAMHFAKLLEDKTGADVTFCVAGETFTAHRTVLAARSPVLMEELYGPTSKTGPGCITVDDMNPVVFRVLLHFIYTDALPTTFDPKVHDYIEIVRQLLLAADRYGMDRLKLICQGILGKHLNLQNVAITLDLAQQHSFHRLKNICMEFIASLNERGALVATHAYAALNSSCPSVLEAIFCQRRNKIRRT